MVASAVGYIAEVRASARRHDAVGASRAGAFCLPGHFKFLVSRRLGTPIQPAFDFLAATFLKGRGSPRLVGTPNSVEAAVRDLCDFHDYLDHLGLEVSAVDDDVLHGYLSSMIGIKSKSTDTVYSPRTIQRRRSTVWKFIGYCQKRGLLKHRFAVETVRTPYGTRESIGAEIYGPDVGPMDQFVRALHPHVVSGLLNSCGPPPMTVSESGEAVPTGHLSRKRLMVETCLQTGIRRAECCDLEVSAIMAVQTAERSPLSTVAIPIYGKGAKWRQVPFPVWLVRLLQSYVREVRTLAVNEALETRALGVDHGKLFVLDGASGQSRGGRIRPGQFSAEFLSAKSGFLNRLSASSDLDDQVLLERALQSRLTIHALRHTFALLTYIKRKAEGDSEPSKYVQAVLGHAFRHTTEAIYLNASHIYESELSDEYTRALLDTIARKKRDCSGSCPHDTNVGARHG